MKEFSSVSFPVMAIVGFPRATSRILENPERLRGRLADLGKKRVAGEMFNAKLSKQLNR